MNDDHTRECVMIFVAWWRIMSIGTLRDGPRSLGRPDVDVWVTRYEEELARL